MVIPFSAGVRYPTSRRHRGLNRVFPKTLAGLAAREPGPGTLRTLHGQLCPGGRIVTECGASPPERACLAAHGHLILQGGLATCLLHCGRYTSCIDEPEPEQPGWLASLVHVNSRSVHPARYPRSAMTSPSNEGDSSNAAPDGWICEECGEHHGQQYDACWNCRATRFPTSPVPTAVQVVNGEPDRHVTMTKPSGRTWVYCVLASLGYFVAGFVVGLVLSVMVLSIIVQVADFPRTIKLSEIACGLSLLAVGWVSGGLLVLLRAPWALGAGLLTGFAPLAILLFVWF